MSDRLLTPKEIEIALDNTDISDCWIKHCRENRLFLDSSKTLEKHEKAKLAAQDWKTFKLVAKEIFKDMDKNLELDQTSSWVYMHEDSYSTVKEKWLK